MKNIILIFLLSFFSSVLNAQVKEDISKGPLNFSSNGVIDGVVIKEDLLSRQAIKPEFVRESDLVWSKRVFSRIDSREKINTDIFSPLDSFSVEYQIPTKVSEIDDPKWNKNQERYSLWTIILRHIMSGDLTVYRANSPLYKSVMDGYSFKYPIVKQDKDDFFNSKAYQSAITDNLISVRAADDFYFFYDLNGNPNKLKKGLLAFQTGDPATGWLDSLKASSPDYIDIDVKASEIKPLWERVKTGEDLIVPGAIRFISSETIIAYYIKEDWFFDKERSLLDRRIIGIAPVVYFEDQPNEPEGELQTIILIDHGDKKTFGSGQLSSFNGQVVERELFWLYFPELRNVIANYFLYNDQNDAQWMSMDDLFWKRKFSAQIYKVSDKFDREIQDYKFGVDALYEAERIKEEIRTWEHDVWNF